MTNVKMNGVGENLIKLGIKGWWISRDRESMEEDLEES
jgi:hypothetical protein